MHIYIYSCMKCCEKMCCGNVQGQYFNSINSLMNHNFTIKQKNETVLRSVLTNKSRTIKINQIMHMALIMIRFVY